MAINYGSSGNGPSADTVTDPQKLFQALPAKEKKYAYLRDVQGDVLGKWFLAEKQKDTVIKMNTGSGKTTVGLLLLKSSLNESVYPAAYFAPDNYLCSQVEAEANALGLKFTNDPRSAEYLTGRAVLIADIRVLFNGSSKFGVGSTPELDLAVAVIDDAHACLATVEGQFTIKIPRAEPAYQPLLNLFSDDMRTQSETGSQEIIDGTGDSLVQVPYWAWQDKQAAVVGLLNKHLTGRPAKFQWPLVKEDLAGCSCFFTPGEVEISTRCLPADVIPSFQKSARRLYMTATLADDSILVTDLGIDAKAVAKPITPKTASDLGERMILVPQEINTGILDQHIKAFVAEYAATQNVAVIVPSGPRASFWADVATPGMTLTAENLDQGVEKLRKTKGNLAVLVNKYEGIDLPDDACRILIVDGVPDTRRLIDAYDQGTLSDSERYLSRQVQRIEQGMGRGIRSNEDYCVVILMGLKLLKVLYAQGAVQYFSPATRKQLQLSRAISQQIAQKGLKALAEPIKDVLTRNPGWVAAAKNALIDVAYPAEELVDEVIILQRQAYEAFRRGKYSEAAEILQNATNTSTEDTVKGWLMEQSAAALHRVDKITSQIRLAAAGDRNRRVTKPLAGITYKKIDTQGVDQAQLARDFLISQYKAGNGLVIGVNAILEHLVFGEFGTDEFEESLMLIGRHLGFKAQRPEKEKTAKLDALWAVGSQQYILFPCKSGATTQSISKTYADQASGNMNWFLQTYGAGCVATPVIVHVSDMLDKDAYAPKSTRVMDKSAMTKFREAAAAYATGIKGSFDNPSEIKAHLSANSLLAAQFLKAFTRPVKKQI
ncbi:MAG TPA: helicase C-terminal domain-containing protein [Xanthobacteraceae bacterium]